MHEEHLFSNESEGLACTRSGAVHEHAGFGAKITVTGTVLDPEGEPLIGASVVAQGAEGVGVSTNIDGQFTLNVDAKATLVFSYVGYNTLTVPVDGRTTINVAMTENSVMLGEVVAIGMDQ